MASENFRRSLELVLKHEGGFTNDPRDPGNWTGGKVGVGELKGTKYGIASHSFPHLDIANLTIEQAGVEYKNGYWIPVRGDDLPAGVDYAVFDFAVNSGPRRAIMSLQRALNVADDGVLGTVTLEAARRKHPEDTITRICADRLAFMRRLSTWPVFGVGWQRRVEGVEYEAVRMALEAAGQRTRVTIDYTSPAPAKPELNCWQKLLRGRFGSSRT